MRKIIALLFTLLLAGCGADSISGTFTLEAAQGYVTRDDAETPYRYIIESENNQVYVARNGLVFTAEELAALDEMTPEKQHEFFGSRPEPAEPLNEITFLEATKEEIILKYDDERVVFTALSDSHFEDEDGIRYLIEYDSLDIQEYSDSLLNN